MSNCFSFLLPILIIFSKQEGITQKRIHNISYQAIFVNEVTMSCVKLLNDLRIIDSQTRRRKKVKNTHRMAMRFKAFISVVFRNHLHEGFSTLDTLISISILLYCAHVDHISSKKTIIACKSSHALIKVKLHPPHSFSMLHDKTTNECTQEQDEYHKSVLDVLVHLYKQL